jgi:prophage regulatory protein
MQSTRIVRRRDLKALTGLSLASTYRLMAQGQFPASLRLSSRAVGWDVADIHEWITTRKASRQRKGGAQ